MQAFCSAGRLIGIGLIAVSALAAAATNRVIAVNQQAEGRSVQTKEATLLDLAEEISGLPGDKRSEIRRTLAKHHADEVDRFDMWLRRSISCVDQFSAEFQLVTAAIESRRRDGITTEFADDQRKLAKNKELIDRYCVAAEAVDPAVARTELQSAIFNWRRQPRSKEAAGPKRGHRVPTAPEPTSYDAEDLAQFEVRFRDLSAPYDAQQNRLSMLQDQLGKDRGNIDAKHRERAQSMYSRLRGALLDAGHDEVNLQNAILTYKTHVVAELTRCYGSIYDARHAATHELATARKAWHVSQLEPESRHEVEGLPPPSFDKAMSTLDNTLQKYADASRSSDAVEAEARVCLILLELSKNDRAKVSEELARLSQRTKDRAEAKATSTVERGRVARRRLEGHLKRIKASQASRN